MKKKVIVIFGLCALLLGSTLYFNYNFLPNTLIRVDGMEYSAGFHGIEKIANSIIESCKMKEYSLVLNDGSIKKYKLEDFADIVDTNEMVEILKKNYNGLLDIGNNVYIIDRSEVYTINDEKLNVLFSGLMPIEENIMESRDAYIGYDSTIKSFKVYPEIIGNVFVDDAFLKLKLGLLETSDGNVDCVKIGLYQNPNIYSTDEILIKNLEYYNKYKDWSVNYKFGNNAIETLTIDNIYSWLVPNYIEGSREINPDKPFIVSSEKIDEYVGNLNKKYTTYGSSRKFKTSTGEELTITKGDYGWWLNIPEMKKSIVQKIESIESGEFDAIYRQKAETYGERDFTNTYVEVSIPNQHIWMYVNGKLIAESDVVTGNISKGHYTRKGVFSLTYKTRDAVLRGPGYASPVSYWMPFDGGIGLHDATWRSRFGGNIYKTNGSHGCVNMPLSTAKIIYNNITSTTPIIVW